MYWMRFLNVNNTQKNKELKNEMHLGGCFSVKKFSGKVIFCTQLLFTETFLNWCHATFHVQCNDQSFEGVHTINFD